MRVDRRFARSGTAEKLGGNRSRWRDPGDHEQTILLITMERRMHDDEPQYKTTAVLNIRSGPGVQHSALPESPLPKGTCLEILEKQGYWALVSVLD